MLLRTRLGPAATVSLFSACLLASGCCGPKLEDVVKEHRPRIEQQLAPLKSIQDQMLRLPRLEQDTWNHTGDPLVLALSFDPSAPANAALSHAEDLQNPEELGYVWGRMPGAGVLNRCASITRRGHTVFDPALPESYLTIPAGITAEGLFKQCEQVRYLVVLRTVEFAEPSSPVPAAASAPPQPVSCSAPAAASASGAPPAATASELRRVFEGGLARAELHVFELNGGRYEGGVRIEAMSSPRVAGIDVATDLRDKLREAVVSGLRSRAPATTFRM